jgi:hypothetical protein
MHSRGRERRQMDGKIAPGVKDEQDPRDAGGAGAFGNDRGDRDRGGFLDRVPVDSAAEGR